MCEIISRYTQTSNGYVKLYLSNGKVVGEHRWLMEQKVGRKLGYNEVVHHLDGNPQNNSLDNLEIRQRSQHAAEHGSTVGRPMITLVCAHCNEEFEREEHIIRYKRKIGQRDFYCTRRCMGKNFGRGRPKST